MAFCGLGCTRRAEEGPGVRNGPMIADTFQAPQRRRQREGETREKVNLIVPCYFVALQG